MRLSDAPSGAGAVVDAAGLEIEEAIRYSYSTQALLQAIQANLQDLGIDSELREVTRRSLRKMIAQDTVAFPAWWLLMKDNFADGFAEVVDNELAKLESTRDEQPN